MSWESVYNLLGIKDFIYFISSPALQDALFPVKLIFIFFTIFFLSAVVYFMMNSSYLKYKFLEDITEFISYQAYGLRAIANRWKKIQKRAETGIESEYKLALIEADDFLNEILEERGFIGNNFEELVNNAGKAALPNLDEIFLAHEIRNSIVYNPDYKIDLEKAKKILAIYESTIKTIGVS
ncbi:MAG: hypothetical protein A2904_00845 [Candidatus Staskawiczbacteria bacterium RIFCSPLOWO2_01_FULL_33_9]|uniref:DUF4129 domain-containing protein n=1 Tax=Candidatus Staskawiczbacteria bacterium RIFCSPLOWO2_01_FULL_33_9 TaxID=1802211 RepID=A0A1G2I8L6_9BACT|nr:MAG: hypothetical protein A2904_00845 [Candidatus Staskawiczbacteria bacterium RIFCSPLOWO2_01_FULL_33_9]